MKSNWVLISFVAILIAFVAHADEGKTKVGVILPLSGDVSNWGQSLKSAMVIANREVGEPFEFFFEDEELCKATKTLNAYHSLKARRDIDIVLTGCLEGARVVAPVAKKDGLPVFITGRSSVEFQTQNPGTLSWLTLLDYEGEALAQFVKGKGYKKIVAFVWEDYFGTQWAKGIQSGLKKYNVDAVLEVDSIPNGGVIDSSIIIKRVVAKPDAIMIMLADPSAMIVIKKIKESGYKGDIIIQSSMINSFGDEVWNTFGGSYQQKFIFDVAKFGAIREQIKVMNGGVLPTDDFVFSYDAIRDLAKVVNDCKKSGQKVSECTMPTFQSEAWNAGASGRYKYMKDGSTVRPMKIVQVREKKLVDVDDEVYFKH